MPRRRLDVELVRRGLASSRAEAQAAVEAGLVTVAGSPATKAASLVAADAPVKVLGPARPFRVPRRREAPGGARSLRRRPARPRLSRRRRVDGWVHGLPVAGGGGARRGRRRRVRPAGVGGAQRPPRDGDGAHERADPGAGRSAVRAGSRRRRPVVHLVARGASGARARRGSATRSSSCWSSRSSRRGRAAWGAGGSCGIPQVWRRVLGEVTDAFGSVEVGVLGVVASPLRGPAGNVEFLLYGRRGVDDARVDLDAAVTEGEGLPR